MDTIVSANISDFLAIGIVGVALSLAVEWIQAKYGVDGSKTKALVIVLSVVLGGIYWFLRDTAIWQSVLGVLAAASTVYALFFSGTKRSA